MATLEQVEKIREKTGVSFEEAKAALEACNDDLLDAIIYLERQGKVNEPAGGGYYSSQTGEQGPQYQDNGGYYNDGRNNCGSNFRESMGRFGRFCSSIFNIGNTNYLEAEKNGTIMFTVPVTVIVVLLIFFFWVIVPLFVVSLFFGFHYHFRGAEIGTEQVNKVMDGASDTVDDIKKNFAGGGNNNNNNQQ